MVKQHQLSFQQGAATHLLSESSESKFRNSFSQGSFITSDVPILLCLVKKGESLMGQNWGCRLGDPISPILGYECVLLCPLLCGVLRYAQEQNPSKLISILAVLSSA
ncbi:hypothetical protein AVEN_209766-1 [Araneus ventricosus]|uniref:Uncharacterized protein n=1 Tax=Araneus ventricosus TaxID=182803 RepID=A0A4Y2CCF2_ARAVE|nr:hypothetical protein AVEN_209766-1 [Araneus ventricosus]